MKSNQELVGHFYDDISETYDTTDFGDLLQNSCLIYCEQIKQHLHIDSPHVLDLAVGTGNAFTNLMQTYPQAYFTGNDLSSGMLSVANNKLPQHFTPICDDAENICQHVSGDSQDLILCNFLFSYVNADTLLASIYQTLKPGGYLSIATTTAKNCRNYSHKFLRYIDRRLGIADQIVKTGVPSSHQQLINQLSQHNFTLTTQTRYQPELTFTSFNDLKNWGSDSGWLASYMHRHKFMKLALVAGITGFTKCFVPSACPLVVNADISIVLAQKPL